MLERRKAGAKRHRISYPHNLQPSACRFAPRRSSQFKFMMDSMQDDELDGFFDFSVRTPERNKRVLRIARGSGCHPAEVENLFHMYRSLGGMFQKMKPAMDPKMQKQAEHMLRNSNKPEHKALLKQLDEEKKGGGGGGMGMGMPGMGDMAQMMNQMGGMGSMGGIGGMGGMTLIIWSGRRRDEGG